MSETNQEDQNNLRLKVIKKLQKRLDSYNQPKKISIVVQIPGLEAKDLYDMSAKEFKKYLDHCKMEMFRAFNLARKTYMQKYKLDRFKHTVDDFYIKLLE